MAQQGVQLDRKNFCCLFCQDLLKDPVTIPCGHNTVSAAAERTERQRELEVSRLNIQQRIQDREKDVKLLQKEVKAVNRSADKAVKDSDKIFTKLMLLMEKRSCDVKQQVRSQQNSLKRSCFEKHGKKLVICSECWHTFTLDSVEDDKMTVDVLLPQPEPKTRAGFLRYSHDITLDPNTAQNWLSLSEGNRKVTLITRQQTYPPHQDRFCALGPQVLSRESLTGRCYWEVKWTGKGIYIAVAYKTISRDRWTGEDCTFGFNGKSWSLYCFEQKYGFIHNGTFTRISGPLSSRVGVYLDHSAGILSFYNVSETMTLLHRVQTTFTEPLYAGLGPHRVSEGDTAEFCKLK